MVVTIKCRKCGYVFYHSKKQTNLDYLLVETQQRDEKRKAHIERLLALMAILLSITQIYPIIQDMMEHWPFCSSYNKLCSPLWRWGVNSVLLFIFVIGFFVLYSWWRKNRPVA